MSHRFAPDEEYPVELSHTVWYWIWVIAAVGSLVQFVRLYLTYHSYEVPVGVLEYGRPLSATLHVPYPGNYRLSVTMAESAAPDTAVKIRVNKNGRVESHLARPHPRGGEPVPPDRFLRTMWYSRLQGGEAIQVELEAIRSGPRTARLQAHVTWGIWHMTGLPGESARSLGILGWSALLLLSLVLAFRQRRAIRCAERGAAAGTGRPRI